MKSLDSLQSMTQLRSGPPLATSIDPFCAIHVQLMIDEIGNHAKKLSHVRQLCVDLEILRAAEFRVDEKQPCIANRPVKINEAASRFGTRCLDNLFQCPIERAFQGSPRVESGENVKRHPGLILSR